MLRKIIKIHKEKCNGCGACAKACHEGAIEMIDGKATLTRENYCDGLGDCLPACPTGAITFEVREAPAYDEAAVLAAKGKSGGTGSCPGTAAKALRPPANGMPKGGPLPCGCPGTSAKSIRRPEAAPAPSAVPSRLPQWPCQIKLVPVHAPYFEEAELVLVCRKRYCQKMDANQMPEDIKEKWYPNKDYHVMYISEIVEALQKK